MWRASILLIGLLSACASSQVGYVPIGQAYEARPAHHDITVYLGDERPQQPYVEVAILDVHMESIGFVTIKLENAIEALQNQARAAGGDAIIEVVETDSGYLEAAMYHVRAKAVRYILE